MPWKTSSVTSFHARSGRTGTYCTCTQRRDYPLMRPRRVCDYPLRDRRLLGKTWCETRGQRQPKPGFNHAVRAIGNLERRRQLQTNSGTELRESA
jgi:hypothetical protein